MHLHFFFLTNSCWSVFLIFGALDLQFSCTSELIGFGSNLLISSSFLATQILADLAVLILPVFEVQHKESVRINTVLLILHKNLGKDHAVNILVDLLILMETNYVFFNIFLVTFKIQHNYSIHFRIKYFYLQSVHVDETVCLANKLVKTWRRTLFPEHVYLLLVILTAKHSVHRKRIHVLRQEDEIIQNKVSINKMIILWSNIRNI